MKFMMYLDPFTWKLMCPGVGIGAISLWVRDDVTCRHDKLSDNATMNPIAYTCKILLGAEWCYRNKECKAMGILHGLKKFHQYCFVKEVCIINGHKPLIALLGKYASSLATNH